MPACGSKISFAKLTIATVLAIHSATTPIQLTALTTEISALDTRYTMEPPTDSRSPAGIPQQNVPVINSILAGPVGSGKTNGQCVVGIQVARQGNRVIAFTRNDTFRKKLPPELRDQFVVIPLEFLRLSPAEPQHLPHSTPSSIVEAESWNTFARWCNAFAKRFQRKDSIMLLQDVNSLVYNDLQTFTTPHEHRQYPAFSDLNELIQTVNYRKRLWGKSRLEESLQLVLRECSRGSRGIYDARKGMPLSSLLQDHNVIIETSSFQIEDALMAIEFFLGSLWQAKVFERSFTQQLEYFIILDDFQNALDPGSLIETMIRESRHAGWHFLLGPQNIGRVSNDILGNCGLFVIVGAVNGHQDLDCARTLLGLKHNDPVAQQLQFGTPGSALVRQPMGDYKKVVAIKIPHLQETPYSEQERNQRFAPLLNELTWTSPKQAHTPDDVPVNASADARDFGKLVEAFVRNANDNWVAPMEAHFAAAGVREGSLKKAVSSRARAMGFTTEPEEGRVMGLNGKRIQLTQVSERARKYYGLQIPDSYKACRGALSTRYYQSTIAAHLKNKLGLVTQLEAQVGMKLKRVDAAIRLHDGRVIALEVASAMNADHELHNIRVLREHPSLIARYVIIAETLKVRQRVQRQLEQANLLPEPLGKLVVTSFYEFVKDPSLYVTLHAKA